MAGHGPGHLPRRDLHLRSEAARLGVDPGRHRLQLSACEDRSHADSRGVLAAWRGRGVASALLDAVIDLAGQRGVPGLSLSVEDGNAARRLYERAGFQVVGRTGGSDTMLLRLGREQRG
ncbi:GNAT family N-acetyltransferase [Actinoplanes sp. URMC 104]|uniref:GNAT family N-acetyltransferase n=1 Tax=Actinoplanes sp. URMC 104 TaxID=3423409 RepID=UPI003F196A85